MSAGYPVAYVTERAELDRSLAEQAQAVGVRYGLGTRCVGIVRTNGPLPGHVAGRSDGCWVWRVRAEIRRRLTGAFRW